MLEFEELIPIIAILTLFLGAPSVVFYWILRIKRESRPAEDSGAVGMQELEERIQRAVVAANEPLRIQIESMEKRLDALARPMLPGASPEQPRLAAHVDENGGVVTTAEEQ